MGQIAWLDTPSHHFKVLHWRESPAHPWKSYTTSPHRQPDLTIKGASKGFTTFQELRRLGYELVATEVAIDDEIQHSTQSPDIFDSVLPTPLKMSQLLKKDQE